MILLLVGCLPGTPGPDGVPPGDTDGVDSGLGDTDTDAEETSTEDTDSGETSDTDSGGETGAAGIDPALVLDGRVGSLVTGTLDPGADPDLAVGLPEVDAVALLLYDEALPASLPEATVVLTGAKGSRLGAAMAWGATAGPGGTPVWFVGAAGFCSPANALGCVYGLDGPLVTGRELTDADLWLGALGAGDGEPDGTGSALALFDLFGDNLPRLAVGVPGADGGHIRIAREGGGKFDNNCDVYSWAPGEGLGTTLVTAGDVDGDGREEVVAGAPAGAGALVLLPGAEICSAPVDAADLPRRLGSETGGGLASALSAGDLDGDGYADILAGAPGERDGAGQVYVLAGASVGWKGQAYAEEVAASTLTGAAGEGLGQALHVGPVDDAAGLDVVAGVAGAAYAWSGPGLAPQEPDLRLDPGCEGGDSHGVMLEAAPRPEGAWFALGVGCPDGGALAFYALGG